MFPLFCGCTTLLPSLRVPVSDLLRLHVLSTSYVSYLVPVVPWELAIEFWELQGQC